MRNIKLTNLEDVAKQGNDRDERRHVVDENMHEEDFYNGEGGRAVMGRPQRQRGLPRRDGQYEMGDGN